VELAFLTKKLVCSFLDAFETGKVKFKKNWLFSCLIFEVFDCGLSFLFIASSQVDLGISIEKGLDNFLTNARVATCIYVRICTLF